MAATTNEPVLNELLIPLHVKYIQSLDNRKEDLEYWLTEHLRVSGVYWGLTALNLINHVDALPKDEVVAYIKSTQHEDGGFGGHLHHNSHILYTLSAIQVLVTLDALDAIDVNKAVECKND
ncbi:unnamed protein product [Absidia cylindrospora]